MRLAIWFCCCCSCCNCACWAASAASASLRWRIASAAAAIAAARSASSCWVCWFAIATTRSASIFCDDSSARACARSICWVFDGTRPTSACCSESEKEREPSSSFSSSACCSASVRGCDELKPCCDPCDSPIPGRTAPGSMPPPDMPPGRGSAPGRPPIEGIAPACCCLCCIRSSTALRAEARREGECRGKKGGGEV